MTSPLHAERLRAILAAVAAVRPARVLDLGCGAGDLVPGLCRLDGVARVVGLDSSRAALERLRARLVAIGPLPAQVDLVEGSVLDAGAALAGFDCAVLSEVIEHLTPDRLSGLERAVFAQMRPVRVVVTTPNAEVNTLLGVPAHRFRHPDHRFEWDRARFGAWAGGVAQRNGYALARADIGGRHPTLGGASQMAVFDRG